MARDFLTRLLHGPPLVTEGATGTALQAMGLPAGVPADEWVMDRPDAIVALHRSYVDAGCDVIMTCSFGANRYRLRTSRHASRVVQINGTATGLARQAASAAARPIFVGGSMGPTGQLVEPLGPLTEADVAEAFAEQAGAMADAGVDFLILETFFALEEARAAINGIQSVTDLPLICSFSYDRGTRTMMGVSPTQMVEALGDTNIAGVGANCGTTLENADRVVVELASATNLPILAKPNAGLPEGDPPTFPVTPGELAQYCLRFLDAGARMVGGCCGTTPAHIAAVVETVHGRGRFGAP